MTLAEWTGTIIAELHAAGFAATEYQGFPLVKRPESIEEGVRLLKLKTTFPADREIYGEGMLFVPAGSRRAAEQIAAEKNGVA